MYAHYRFEQYAAVCHYCPFVYVSGAPDSMTRFHPVKHSRYIHKWMVMT